MHHILTVQRARDAFCDMPENSMEAFLEGNVAIRVEVSALNKMFSLIVPFLKFYLKEIMSVLTEGS